MARYRAELKSDRGAVTRTGHRSLEVNVNGWDLGIRVVAMPAADGRDEFRIYATEGSNGESEPSLLMTVCANDDGKLGHLVS